MKKIKGHQSLINNKQKSLFEEMQKSFSNVSKEFNSQLDKKAIEKDMKKSYMKLLSNKGE